MRDAHRHSKMKSAIVAVLISCLVIAALTSPAETKKHWQTGTIVDVKAHEGAPANQDAAKQFDVSIKVGKKIYITLYEGEQDQADPGFYVGVTRTVLVNGDTLKINDLQGNTRSLRILSTKDAPADSK